MSFDTTIDSFLIKHSQRLTVYCEESLGLARIQLGYLLITLSFIPLLILATIFITCSLVALSSNNGAGGSLLTLLFSSLGTFYVLWSRKRLLGEHLEESLKTLPKTLPKEIAERYDRRLSLTLFTSAIIISVLVYMISFSKNSSLVADQSFTILIVFFLAFLFAAMTEYFLCTYSPPPEENSMDNKKDLFKLSL